MKGSNMIELGLAVGKIERDPFLYFPTTGRVIGKISQEASTLTSLENSIFAAIVNANGEIVPKESLYETVRQRRGTNPEPNIIDVKINHLRAKLDKIVEKGGDYIETIHGIGYRLADSPIPRKSKAGVKHGQYKRLIARLREIHATPVSKTC
jgi:DNA-binding response OmpR family regulator